MCIDRNLNKLIFSLEIGNHPRVSSLSRCQTPFKIICPKFSLQLWGLFHSCSRSGSLRFVEQSSLSLPFLYSLLHSLLVSDGGFRVFLRSEPHKHMIKTEDLGKDLDFFWKIFCCLFEFMRWGQDSGSQKCM